MWRASGELRARSATESGLDAAWYVRQTTLTDGTAEEFAVSMSRFWPQRRQIVQCNLAISNGIPRGMRPGADVMNGGVVAYNDDAELVAALHRGDRAARTVLVQRYEPLVERLVAGALGIDSEIS